MKKSLAILLPIVPFCFLIVSSFCLLSCSNDDESDNNTAVKKEVYGFAPIYTLHSRSLSSEELENEVQNQLKTVGFTGEDLMYLEGEDSVAVAKQLKVVAEKIQQALSVLPKDVVGFMELYGHKVMSGADNDVCVAMYRWYRKNYSLIVGSTEGNGGVTLTIESNTVLVQNAIGKELCVYNVAGVCVYRTTIDVQEKTIELNLPIGCYIVKVGNSARKISIK